ncbi:peptide deformylase [bacterium]|nr:peptide deformylase [bacterium]
MAILPIKLYGEAVLSRQASKVDKIDKELIIFIAAMAQAMYKYGGVGLAAPQVGVSKRIIIADIGMGINCLINPRILQSFGEDIMIEGCLSLPKINLEIKRPEEIIVEGMNENGKQVQLAVKGLLSRVIQHEIDHLEGVLIVDRVSKKKLKPLKKQLEEIIKKTVGVHLK